jgi:hypothetical protein
MEYNPKKTPEIDVVFGYLPEEEETFHDPGAPAEVEIDTIKIHGLPISEALADHLIERFGDDWEKEIIQRAREYASQKRRL